MVTFARTIQFWLLPVAGLLLSASIVGQAKATTVTFDSQPTGIFSPFTQGGYSIAWVNYPNGTYAQALQNVGGSNQNVVVDATPFNVYGVALRITRIDGNPFTLASLGVADLNKSSIPSTTVPDPCSYLSILVSSSAGNCVGYAPSSSTFETVSPSGMADITWLEVGMISYGGRIHSVDNVVLSAVPEPSTALLLTLGLVGLNISRRTKISK
jgi:hypothetical protein